MNPILIIGVDELRPRKVWACASRVASVCPGEASIRLCIEAKDRIERSSRVVQRASLAGKPVYGLNTGVGALRDVSIDSKHLTQLQLNLLRSHASGVGEPLAREIVAAMWIHLLNSTAQGHRGIRLETAETIIQQLNHGILAQVPSKGSVGASGDLAPAAHAALVLIGEGVCSMPINGRIEILRSIDALRKVEMSPVTLGPKEGLSLINGTHLTTAYACQAWTESERLWRTAALALALSTIGLRHTPTISRPEALELHHPATVYAGLTTHDWLEGAAIPFRNHNQDPYCFRCAPHVHGAVWKEIDQCEEWIIEELAATTDNPIVMPDTEEFVYGGNFHAIYPARVLDRLASAMTQLGSISERRINAGMDSRKTGLPNFLIPESGLNSGLMMAQTTAAALVSECKALSFPASVDSIPTNCDQEDHVSMGPIAGLKAVQITRNLRDILAIEIIAAVQAIHLRGLSALPPRLQTVYEIISLHVPPIYHDRVFAEDIKIVSRLIEEEALFVGAPRSSLSFALGELN